MKNYTEIKNYLPDNCTFMMENDAVAIIIHRNNQEHLLCYIGPDEYDGQLTITDDSYIHDLAVAKHQNNQEVMDIVTNHLYKTYGINHLGLVDEYIKDTSLDTLVDDVKAFVDGMRYAGHELEL